VLVTGAHSGLKDQIEEQYHDQDAFKKNLDMVYEGQKDSLRPRPWTSPSRRSSCTAWVR